MTTPAYPKSVGAQVPRIESKNESAHCRSFDSSQPACVESAGRQTKPKKPNRRFGWRAPSSGKKRPSVVEATAAAVVRGLEKRLGPLYWRLAAAAPIAGYSAARGVPEARKRAWRRDGVESVLGMLVALCYSADVRDGFIGKPANGKRWKRFDVRDLSQFAYRAKDPATLKRASRALYVLEHLGLIKLVAQVRVQNSDGSWASEPAVRKLNWSKLAEMCGTGWLLSQARQALDRAKGKARETVSASAPPMQETQPAPLPVPTQTHAPPRRSRPLPADVLKLAAELAATT